MKRRSFIGALVATFATPAKMLEMPKPLLPGFTGFVSIDDYVIQYSDDGVTWTTAAPLYTGEIGRYEGVRFIESAGAHRYWRAESPQQWLGYDFGAQNDEWLRHDFGEA